MKKILPIFLFLAFTVQLSAQVLNQDWATDITNTAGATYERLSVVVAHENGTIAAGQSTSILGYDMYVASFDNNGLLLWEEYIDTPNNSAFTHMLADGDGNYYLVGYEILTAFFRRRVHLAKINSAGEIQWHTTYSGPENINAWANDMTLVNGKVHICGVEIQPDGFDSGFVAQFDEEGDLVWGEDFHPEGFGNEFNALAVAPNGNVTAVGYSDAGWELYAIQYDSNGNLNWTFFETYEYEDEMFFNDIQVDENGELYTMFTAESGFFEQSVITHKRSGNFDVIWENIDDSGGQSEGLSLSLGSDASVYAFIDEEDSFDHLARIVKIDNEGNELFSVADVNSSGSNFEKGVLSDNDVAFVSTRDLDFFYITSYSSDGTLIESVVYEEPLMYSQADISVYGNRVAVVVSEIQDVNAALLSLNANDLTEQYFITTTGTPMPDARPGKIVTEGNRIWLASYGDSGPTGTYTISSLDPSGNVEWENSITQPTVIPEFDNLQPDGNGNIIGLYQNYLFQSEGYYGLFKLDSDGNEVFNLYFDDVEDNHATTLCVDNDGNSYVGGFNPTTGIMFLARYDANGNLDWQEEYASPSDAFPAARPLEMRFTDQGKIVIGSIHRGADEISDLHIFQYDNNGTLEWHSDVLENSGNSINLFDMEIESNGDIYLFGTSGIVFVAAQMSASGDVDWTYTGSMSQHQPRSMTRDDAGNVYLCFSSVSEAYFRKLDSAGNLLTENAVTTNSSGVFYYPYESTVINEHLVVLGDHLHNDFGIVSFEMVLSDDLEPQYVAIDSTQAARIESAARDANGNYYGAYLAADFDVEKSARTAIVKKFSMNPLGINDDKEEPEVMTIFPNPSTGDFEIALKLKQPGNFQVSVRDIHGRLIHQFSPEQQLSTNLTVRYNLPRELARGIYLVELNTAGAQTVQRIVLE